MCATTARMSASSSSDWQFYTMELVTQVAQDNYRVARENREQSGDARLVLHRCLPCGDRTQKLNAVGAPDISYTFPIPAAPSGAPILYGPSLPPAERLISSSAPPRSKPNGKVSRCILPYLFFNNSFQLATKVSGKVPLSPNPFVRKRWPSPLTS